MLKSRTVDELGLAWLEHLLAANHLVASFLIAFGGVASAQWDILCERGVIGSVIKLDWIDFLSLPCRLARARAHFNYI